MKSLEENDHTVTRNSRASQNGRDAKIMMVSMGLKNSSFCVLKSFLHFFFLHNSEKGMCLLGEQCPYDHGIDPVVITGPIPPPYAPPPFPMNIPPPPPPSLPNSSNGLMLPSVIPPPHPPMTVTTTSGTVQLSDIAVYMYVVLITELQSLSLIFHQLV